MIVGIGTHSLAESELDIIGSLGIQHIRHTAYAYLPLDVAGIQHACDLGFKPLIVVHGVEPAELDLDAWTEWMEEACLQLPDVDAWQIGNEVPFFGDFATHASYHIAAYEVIKDLTSAHVVSMDLSDALRRERLKHLSYDARAVHTYEYPCGPQIDRLATQLQGEIWITEFGIDKYSIPADHAFGSGTWEHVQASQWHEALSTAASAKYARAYAYQLRTDEIAEHHGIVRSDDTLRPAANVIRDFIINETTDFVF